MKDYVSLEDVRWLQMTISGDEVMLGCPFEMQVGEHRVGVSVTDGDGQHHTVSFVVARVVTEADWRAAWAGRMPEWRANITAAKAAGFYAVLMD